MLVLPQIISVKWAGPNRKHFENKGYIFSKGGDEFKVNVLDLPPSSRKEVKVICDYCNTPYLTVYCIYGVNRKEVQKDHCKNCLQLKKQDIQMKKHGVKHHSQRQEVQNKISQTNIERYGCKNHMQNPEFYEKYKQMNLDKTGYEYNWQRPDVKEKIASTSLERYGITNPGHNIVAKEKRKQTNLERFGVENPYQSEIIKNAIKEFNLTNYGVEYNSQRPDVKKKIENTNLERYGAINPFSNKDVRQKIKKTNLIRYGYEVPSKSEIVKTKIRNTMYINGTCKSSRQQRYIAYLLKGKLNYPFGYYPLDIAFTEEKFYIEYDGGGHNQRVERGILTAEEFRVKELKRYFFLKNNGWREIRIISMEKDLLPSDEVIIEWVSKAKDYLNTGHSWFEINIDESKVRCSQYEQQVDFGDLRRIKKEDIE